MSITSMAALLLAATINDPVTGEKIDCDNAMTQYDMNVCAYADYSTADDELNRVYAEVMARAKISEKEFDGPDTPEHLRAYTAKRLRAAQRAWIAFRDSECAFRTSGSVGGSIHSMVITQCETEFAIQRTEELKAYRRCEEGDFQCPL